MATSSKTVFKLKTLQEKAVSAIDERIAAKVLEIENFDRLDQTAELGEWRNGCIAMIEGIYVRRFDCTDAELAGFHLPKKPHLDTYQRDRMEKELQTLQARRAKTMAKSGSLAPDADGNIALTKTQLSEFFDL